MVEQGASDDPRDDLGPEAESVLGEQVQAAQAQEAEMGMESVGRAPLVAMDTASEAQAELLQPLGGDNALNLFKTLANHPKLMRSWLRFGGQLLQRSTLSDRERELVILRVAVRCGSAYEWGQHVGIARQAGLSDDEIRLIGALSNSGEAGPEEATVGTGESELAAAKVGSGEPNSGPDTGRSDLDRSNIDWSATDAALLAAADELLADHRLGQSTLTQLSATHSTEQLIELTMLVGHYAMIAGLLRTFEVPTEGPLPGLGQV